MLEELPGLSIRERMLGMNVRYVGRCVCLSLGLSACRWVGRFVDRSVGRSAGLSVVSKLVTKAYKSHWGLALGLLTVVLIVVPWYCFVRSLVRVSNHIEAVSAFPRVPFFIPSTLVLFFFLWHLVQVVGIVILLGPRVEGLVSTVLQVEAGKRSRFPPGLEPKRRARGGVGVAGEGARAPSSEKVMKTLLHAWYKVLTSTSCFLLVLVEEFSLRLY